MRILLHQDLKDWIKPMIDDTSSTNEAVNTAHDVPAARQASSSTYADDVMFSFFVNQSNSPPIDNENLVLPRYQAPNMRQAENLRKSQSPRVDKRNWNGIITQKLGDGFEFNKKACFVGRSLNHLIKDCNFYGIKCLKSVLKLWEGLRRNGQGKFRPLKVATRSEVVVSTFEGIKGELLIKVLSMLGLETSWKNSIYSDGLESPKEETNSLILSAGVHKFINASPIPKDSSMQSLESTVIFDDAYDDREVGAEVDLNNLETTMNISPIPTTRIHKDHPKDQIIGDINSATQTRRMTKISEEHAMVWTLVDLPKGKRAIGTKWVYRNKKDERVIVVRNKAKLGCSKVIPKKEGMLMMRFLLLLLGLKQSGQMVISVVHVVVDDIIFGSIKKSLCVEFEQMMHKRFQMSSMGELTFYLGLQVKQKDDGIFISQDKYVADILKKFDFVTAKTASTPIKTNKALLKDEEAEDVDVHLSRSMIRSLMYLTASRPNIIFVVCACARDSLFDLEACSDSDYDGASLDRKSTTRGCQFLGKKLISWQCKKQTIVANSTTEAEYVVAANCYGQVLWIQNQMLDYGFNFMNTEIYIDNESTICIVKNPVFHAKTKHIEIRYHFIRDSYEKRLIQVIKIHTDHNVVDLLTKALDVSSDEFRVKTGSCKVNAARKDLVLLGEKKSEGNANFHEIVDFLTASSIHYALTVSPTIYASYIEQFWNTAHSQTVNDVKQIHATVDGKTVVISESSVRSDLHFNDEDGITCLTNDAIFENLALMGYESDSNKLTFQKALFSPQWKYLIHTILHCLSSKSTSWNEFSTNIASAVICLANGQKFNFSKLIFDGMLRNLDTNTKKFLMYPRFLQLFLNNQITLAEPFNDVYQTPAHTKKVFTNMKRKRKYFSERVTLLFASMLAPPVVEGEGSGQPSEPQPAPSTAQPRIEEQIPVTESSSPQNTQSPRQALQEDTQFPQTSVHIPNVADEAVFKEWDDRVVRATTTAASLDAAQASGNISKTQSTAMSNDPLSQEIGSGDRPRCQEAMGGVIAQTRSERASKHSYDSPLLGGNTPGSDEERIEQDDLMDFVPPTPHDSPLSGGHTPGSDEGRPNINELMAICTNLSNRVLALEQSKTAQDLVIRKLKKKVRKLEKKLRARTLGMKLFKIGTSKRRGIWFVEYVSKRGGTVTRQNQWFGFNNASIDVVLLDLQMFNAADLLQVMLGIFLKDEMMDYCLIHLWLFREYKTKNTLVSDCEVGRRTKESKH
ncbi:putative ribonuclease H-like domain-containing protein [Tanacetum coccineum]